MKFSEQWLREQIKLPVDTASLCQQLTMLGLEVDDVAPAAPDFSSVVIGSVLSAKQHPDADRLRVCEVDVANEAPLQIVCGAANAREGIFVAVALVGAVLPGNFNIKRSKLRGVVSEGMLCAATELGLEGMVSDGILELPKDAPVGESLRDYLSLDDQVIDIDLTPNRGDCLSIEGVARDLSALNNLPYLPIAPQEHTEACEDVFNVDVTEMNCCSAYRARIIKGICQDATTPIWMQERLRRAGVRAIHPVVDVTNYVMLALGQPMHAFDYATIKGNIQVRLSQPKEVLTLLDGAECVLSAPALIVADDEKALALAGIMGGMTSSVTDKTHDIVIESACFNASMIAVTSRKLGIQSDSSYRFSRGVDPLLSERAMNYATDLLLDIVGGEVVCVSGYSNPPSNSSISFRPDRVFSLLGLSLPAADIAHILERLFFQVEKTNDSHWQVTVPSFRSDVTQEADLIEEVARLYGYDQLPTASFSMTSDLKPKPPLGADLLAKFLVSNGFHETITYSFVAKAWLESLFISEAEAVMVKNPLSQDMAVMRTCLLPGLLQCVQHNVNRQNDSMMLYEQGQCFSKNLDGSYHQYEQLAFLMTGNTLTPAVHGVRATDFYDIKGVLDTVFSGNELVMRTEDVPAFLHPGQSANVILNDVCIGYIGSVHPALIEQLKINQAVFVCELSVAKLPAFLASVYSPISKFPMVRRDLSVIVEESLPVAEILGKIQGKLGACLNSVNITDVYQGQGIEKNKKSIVINLVFQSNDKTLEEEDIEKWMAEVIKLLETVYSAVLRT